MKKKTEENYCHQGWKILRVEKEKPGPNQTSIINVGPERAAEWLAEHAGHDVSRKIIVDVTDRKSPALGMAYDHGADAFVVGPAAAAVAAATKTVQQVKT